MMDKICRLNAIFRVKLFDHLLVQKKSKKNTGWNWFSCNVAGGVFVGVGGLDRVHAGAVDGGEAGRGDGYERGDRVYVERSLGWICQPNLGPTDTLRLRADKSSAL